MGERSWQRRGERSEMGWWVGREVGRGGGYGVGFGGGGWVRWDSRFWEGDAMDRV